MKLSAFNRFCGALPHATHVVQWGGSHVWKVGGKVFAIGHVEDDGFVAASFKCSPMSFDMLKEMPELRPAPYLASRGMKWIQRTGAASLDDEAFGVYLRESHRLVALGLTRARRRELGLDSMDRVAGRA